MATRQRIVVGTPFALNDIAVTAKLLGTLTLRLFDPQKQPHIILSWKTEQGLNIELSLYVYNFIFGIKKKNLKCYKKKIYPSSYSIYSIKQHANGIFDIKSTCSTY
jgi:hypothetical protein